MGNFLSKTEPNQSVQTPSVDTTGSSAALESTPASPSPIPLLPLSNPSSASCKVFISHAGEDKVTIAIPLREKLLERGVTAFVDQMDMPPGTEATQAMINAMKRATVAVLVLSPEYVARKWPMKELMHFLKRRDQCMSANVEGLIIIPFFYRISIRDLYDEPRLDRTGKDGNKLYEVSRFYERQKNGEPEGNIAEIKAALTKVHGIMGIENFVNANNDNTIKMSFNRNTMLEELANRVCAAISRSTVSSVGPELRGELERETFQAYFDKPHDVLDLVFDFELKDSNSDVCTQEGKILEMLLDESKERNRAIAIRGIGGVGKTSLLRKIRSLKNVSNRFRDGVYSIALGKDATRVGLQEMLISVVLKSGGKHTARSMHKHGDMRKVIEAFHSWFAEKQCLFVIDDVWDTKEVTHGVIRDLWTLHASGRDSKTLLTTKSIDIAADGGACAFLEPRLPLEAESRAILYHYAGLKPEEGKDDDNKAVEEILERCAGLPLLLAVAGKGVKALSFRRNHTECSAYHFYSDQLKEGMADLINRGVGSHAGLSAALNISIELAEERKERFEFDVSCDMAEMHRRLSVLKKQMRVPMIMLKKLWEVENESEAARIAKEFEQVGLADVEYEKKGCRFVEVLRLHDSVYEFAVYETKVHKEEEVGHKTVLEGYGNELVRNSKDRVVREWWSKTLEDDKYIHGNLCRHLMGAKLEEELFGLLLSPEWLERQIELSAVSSAEHDFSLGMKAIQKGTGNRGGDESDEMEEALMLIREAVTLSSSYIMRNGRELWFQVHGRLKRAGEHNRLVHEYVRNIEGEGLKPRMFCTNGILMEAGGPNTRIIYIESGIACMVLLRDGERVACGCSNGDIAIVKFRHSERERRWRAHGNGVTAINVGKEDEQIVSGSRDQTAKVWNAQSGSCVASFKGIAKVTCVAITEDGERAVCCCEDGSVQVWEIESGLRVSGPIKWFAAQYLTVFKDGEHVLKNYVYGHPRIWNVSTETVVGAGFDREGVILTCAKMTADESLLVCGSLEGEVLLWDVESRQRLGNTFKVHDDFITCVGVSADGRRFVAGSEEKLLVLDVESGEQVCEPLFGASEFTGVSLLGQGDAMVSCSRDGTVRVWNFDRKRKSSRASKQRSSREIVSFSSSGRFVVSSSWNGLQMWNAITGQAVGEPTGKENDYIVGMALTLDDRFAVTVSERGIARLWDLQSREAVCKVEGYSSGFSCVAVTPDGKHFVTGSRDSRVSPDNSVRVWDLKSMDGSCFVLEGHRDNVESVFVSDDGKRIISVDGLNEIIVWDIETQAEMKRMVNGDNAYELSRRQVLRAAGESTLHDEADLSIHRNTKQIVHGEGRAARVLGTLEIPIFDWDISPDKKTICVSLDDGQLGFLKLEI